MEGRQGGKVRGALPRRHTGRERAGVRPSAWHLLFHLCTADVCAVFFANSRDSRKYTQVEEEVMGLFLRGLFFFFLDE